MTREQISAALMAAQDAPGLKANANFVYTALQGMYARQTADEQHTQGTRHQNGIGFGSRDAEFLSSVAERSRQYRTLTPNQARAVAKALVKYSRQIAEFMPDTDTEQPVPAAQPITDTPPLAEVLGYNGIAYRIRPMSDGRYSVTLYDADARQEDLDSRTVYTTEAAAESAAHTYAERSFNAVAEPTPFPATVAIAAPRQPQRYASRMDQAWLF
jgi:hypothetical protein